MDQIYEILQQSLLIYIWLCSFMSLFVGIAMIVKPKQFIRFNRSASRWIDTGSLSERFDSQHHVERFFYRHHTLMGGGVLIGAAFILYTFLFRYNLRVISTAIPNDYLWLSDAMVAMILVGSVVAALVGCIVMVKPSLLRDIEASANRWISIEGFSNRLNENHQYIQDYLFQRSRTVGLFVLVGSLYVCAIIGYFLFFKNAVF